MIRFSVRPVSVAVMAAFCIPVLQAAAQQHVPPAPDSPAPSASQAQAPAAPTPAAPAPSAAPVFPAPDPANFTAASPTKDLVNAFLTANWGYDDNRMWQVQAILKTPVEGISKVVILIGDKSGKEKPQAFSFFVTPDGKHIITGDAVIDFGARPYDTFRDMVKERADGPYRGSASKDLELVEFADFQCPHCKEAQANIDKLVTDFPKARVVFQNFPIASIHPQAPLAAAYGACVNKQGGSSAFFQYASAVFDGQDGLTSADGTTLTLNSAVTKAGLDPAKIAACAATPETKAQVDASVKLATDLSIGQVPMLVVNGREVPATAPYDLLKKIVTYQAKLDNISLQ